MQLYVLSRARAERMHLPFILNADNVPFTLVVDTKEQAQEAKRLLPKPDVLVTHAKDIVEARNFITRYHLRTHGKKYYCGMDDNIRFFTMVMSRFRDAKYGGKNALPTHSNEYYPLVAKNWSWRHVFNQQCTPKQYMRELGNLCDKMVTEGIRYGGVATMENPFFRGTRYSYHRFVKSKVFIMDPTAGLEWKHTMCHDSHMTALCIARYGKVLVNNFMFYKARWYERGGLGSREAREAAGLLDQLELCVKEFPGLVALASGKNSALRIMRVTDASINRWREEHLYL